MGERSAYSLLAFADDGPASFRRTTYPACNNFKQDERVLAAQFDRAMYQDPTNARWNCLLWYFRGHCRPGRNCGGNIELHDVGRTRIDWTASEGSTPWSVAPDDKHRAHGSSDCASTGALYGPAQRASAHI